MCLAVISLQSQLRAGLGVAHCKIESELKMANIVEVM